MKPNFNYSNNKFSSFSRAKKLKILLEFIRFIPEQWFNVEMRKKLLNNFKMCLEVSKNDSIINPENLTHIIDNLDGMKSIDDFLFHTKHIWHNYGASHTDMDLTPQPENNIFLTQSKNNLPLNVVLDNLRSAYNVGSIIRTSECFTVDRLYFCGYTPTPDNPKVKKTTMGTEFRINWLARTDIKMLLEELKQHTTIIALETSPNAQMLHQTVIPKPATIIVGNEALGISKEALDMADIIVKIPILGWKQSYNVATAFGIACYEIYKQWSASYN